MSAVHDGVRSEHRSSRIRVLMQLQPTVVMRDDTIARVPVCMLHEAVGSVPPKAKTAEQQYRPVC